MKKMNRIIAMLLCIGMVIASLSACGGGAASSAGSDEAPASSSEAAPASSSEAAPAASSEAEAEPEGDAPLEFTIAARNNYVDTMAQQLLEERFNIKMDIEEVYIDDPEEYNLYWATGHSPDVAFNRNMDVTTFARQGLIRSFPIEWLEEYMPNYMNAIYDYMGVGDRELGKARTEAQICVDGECYVVPQDSMTNHIGMIMCMRQDWLDAVGVTELPKTIDDLHDILYKFTYEDPDGDGLQDTYGMHGAARNQRFGTVFVSQGFWPFSYYMNDDGSVYYTSTTEKYKDSLKLLASWYAEGIIDPEFITEQRADQRDKWAQGLFGCIIDHPWWFALNTANNVQSMLLDVDPDARLTFVPPLVSEDGKQYVNAWFCECYSDAAVFFGHDCPDEVLIQWLKIMEEAITDKSLYMQLNYGVEGEDYTFVDGKLERNADLMNEDRYSVTGAGLFYNGVVERDWLLENITPDAEAELYEFSLSYDQIFMDNDFLLPGVSDEIANKVSDVETIATEYYANAISGVVDIDSTWDSYLADLDNAGLPDILQVYAEGGIK